MAWRYFSQRYREHKLESKELYLQRCTYYVLDPHMDIHGVRRKIRRVIPPTQEYERARVSRNEMSTENTRRVWIMWLKRAGIEIKWKQTL